MKKLITFAAVALLSSSVFAGTHKAHNVNSFNAGSFESKSAAYDAGFDLAEQFDEMSQSQLRRKLRFGGNSGIRNISVGKTKVSVEEFAESKGKIAYRATVKVGYTYKYHESNND